MEISEGDVLLITSAHGSIRVKAYLMPGIHPGSVAVASDRGMSPMAASPRTSG